MDGGGLRSPGSSNSDVCDVGGAGFISASRFRPVDSSNGVRPALYINQE